MPRDLEISYHREMKQNYLMIQAEAGEDETLEARMMEENSIEGLLRFRMRREDGRCWCCYEITSRQPLSRLLENRSIGAEQIRSLLLGIARTLMGIGDYLLSEAQILLRPEYIYVNTEDFRPELCLLPGWEGNFPEEFSRLLQFLLGKTDHQDQEAVVLIYGLYRESLKDNYGLDNLLRWLAASPGPDVPRSPAGSPDWSGRDDSVRIGRGSDDSEPVRYPPESAAGDKARGKGFIFLGVFLAAALAVLWLQPEIAARWRYGVWAAVILAGGAGIAGVGTRVRPFFRTRESSREQRAEPESWEMAFAGDTVSETSESVFSEDTGPPDSHTVLLQCRDYREDVRCLAGQEGTAETIPISYYPFLIGKQKSITDYAVSRDTISRLHARVDRRDGRYWLTDLNSTNGTAVNGRMLEANETVLLEEGDTVALADMNFRFQ